MSSEEEQNEPAEKYYPLYPTKINKQNHVGFQRINIKKGKKKPDYAYARKHTPKQKIPDIIVQVASRKDFHRCFFNYKYTYSRYWTELEQYKGNYKTAKASYGRQLIEYRARAVNNDPYEFQDALAFVRPYLFYEDLIFKCPKSINNGKKHPDDTTKGIMTKEIYNALRHKKLPMALFNAAVADHPHEVITKKFFRASIVRDIEEVADGTEDEDEDDEDVPKGTVENQTTENGDDDDDDEEEDFVVEDDDAVDVEYEDLNFSAIKLPSASSQLSGSNTEPNNSVGQDELELQAAKNVQFYEEYSLLDSSAEHTDHCSKKLKLNFSDTNEDDEEESPPIVIESHSIRNQLQFFVDRRVWNKEMKACNANVNIQHEKIIGKKFIDAGDHACDLDTNLYNHVQMLSNEVKKDIVHVLADLTKLNDDEQKNVLLGIKELLMKFKK